MSVLISTLKQAAQEIGLNLTDKQLDLFQRYYDLLLEWNEKINLTAITEPREVAIKHFIDSLSCLSVLDIPVGASVVDIGTGAGFPGIPLKIYRPDLKITLMDSLNKRINFLNLTIDTLGLSDIQAVHARAEDFGQNPIYREKFDFAISRAVARLVVLVEYCLPPVKVNGYFISQKGPDMQDEATEAGKAIKTLGGHLQKLENLYLPILKDGRSIIVIKKDNTTPKAYPRKAGTPSKKPLL